MSNEKIPKSIFRLNDQQRNACDEVHSLTVANLWIVDAKRFQNILQLFDLKHYFLVKIINLIS